MSMANLTFLPFYVSEVLPHLGWSGAGYLAWRLVRAYERQSMEAGRLRALARRVRQLEASMGRVRRCVASTVDAQRFTNALLLDRPKPAAIRTSDSRG